MESFKFDLSILLDKGTSIIGNLVAAIVIFWIGKLVANKVSDIARGMMEKGKLDPTLVSFLGNVTFGVMMMVVMMAALNRLGVDTTSIVAIMGGAAVAIGLALQDQLSNFAAGVLIILFRPFRLCWG